MSHDTSLALELPAPGVRPGTQAKRRGARFSLRWSLRRAGSDPIVATYEQPLDRIDRLHAEYRAPLGRF